MVYGVQKVAVQPTCEDKALVAAGGLLVQSMNGHAARSAQKACVSSRHSLQPPLLLNRGGQSVYAQTWVLSQPAQQDQHTDAKKAKYKDLV